MSCLTQLQFHEGEYIICFWGVRHNQSNHIVPLQCSDNLVAEWTNQDKPTQIKGENPQHIYMAVPSAILPPLQRAEQQQQGPIVEGSVCAYRTTLCLSLNPVLDFKAVYLLVATFFYTVGKFTAHTLCFYGIIPIILNMDNVVVWICLSGITTDCLLAAHNTWLCWEYAWTKWTGPCMQT